MSRRRAEGLQQWVSLWNLGLCSGDGLYSLMNELVVSSTGSRLTRRERGGWWQARKTDLGGLGVG